jgi:hypothetical protein
MGEGMRAVKIAAVVMGVLIVLGTAGLVVGIVMRRPPPSPGLPPNAAVVLDEPEGTHITGVATVQDRLAVALQGGGTDRLVLVDPRTGAVTGRITLRH